MANQGLSFFSTTCRALIIGSSGAIGSALVKHLSNIIGADRVVGVSRIGDGLELLKPASIEAISNELDGNFRLIIDATGALEYDGIGPEKTLHAIDYDNMVNQFKVNAIGPALVLKNFEKFFPRTGKTVFASLSARVGSIGDNRLGGWISYRSSKAALNQIIKTASIELSRKYPECICVAIHPGTVKSKLTEKYIYRHDHVLPEEAASNIISVLNSLDCKDTGGFYDYAGRVIVW